MNISSTRANPITPEAVWREFSDRLGHFIRARVGDQGAADDIRQEVFLKISQHLGDVQDFRRFESWLFQIARHAIADYFRVRQHPTLAADEASESAMDGRLDREAQINAAEWSRLMESFRHMIEELPEPYRQAVQEADLNGVPHKDLAERWGLSVSGVKSRVLRGRAQLKQKLMACCQFEFDRRGHLIDCQPHGSTSCRCSE